MRLQLADGVVDLDAGTVDRTTKTALSPLETRLLRYLAAVRPRAASNDELLSAVFGYVAAAQSRTVRVTVQRIRAKLEANPKRPVHLVTVRGSGYRLAADPVRDAALHPPPEHHPMHGRDVVLLQARDALHARNALTLEGPPGVGKTRLALALAHSWNGPVAWFSTEPSADLPSLLGFLATRLRVRETEPRNLGRLLAERVTLVVLDGVEHLAAELGVVLDGWLAETPLNVLVTSRVPLGLAAEQRLEVPPLPAAPAIELLTERSGRMVDEVLHLLDACDGLPLALELTGAAARSLLPDVQPAAVALDAAVRRSWDLLGERGQWALASTAAFEGAFALADAAPVVGEGSPALLLQLRTAGLLHREGSQLRMLRSVAEPVRRLAPHIVKEARSRHLDWLVGRAKAWSVLMRTGGLMEAATEIVSVRHELEAAMRFAIPARPGDAASVLSVYRFAVMLLTGESVDAWLELLLSADPPDEDRVISLAAVHVEAQAVRGDAAAMQELRDLVERGLAADCMEGAGHALLCLVRALVLTGAHQEAETVIVEGLALPLSAFLRARLFLGKAKVLVGRGESGLPALELAREALGGVVDPSVSVSIAATAAREHLDNGHLDKAHGCAVEALSIASSHGEFLQPFPLQILARIDAARGDLNGAMAAELRLVGVLRRFGRPRAAAVSAVRAAGWAVELDAPETDLRCAEASEMLESLEEPGPNLRAMWLQVAVRRALDTQDARLSELVGALSELPLDGTAAGSRSSTLALVRWAQGEPPGPMPPGLLLEDRCTWLALLAADGDRDAESLLHAELSPFPNPLLRDVTRAIRSRRTGDSQLAPTGMLHRVMRRRWEN